MESLGIYYLMVGLDWMIAETSSRGGPAKLFMKYTFEKPGFGGHSANCEL